jgi:pimeloyl-ACP methyl ester carboxylesterase
VVLVHGAWVGEWSWSPLIPLLEASGRPVHAVSLRGHGVRSHESSPEIGLDDHVEDLVTHVETCDLTSITLVGHSYGGRVITAAYPALRDRVSRMVYLDAHAPTAPDAGQSPDRIEAARATGGFLPFSGYDPNPADIGGEAGLSWFLDRVRPQSFKTFMVPMTGTLPASLPKAYVFCSGYGPSRFEEYAKAAAVAPDWEYHDLDTDHWPMFNRTADVAAIVLGERTGQPAPTGRDTPIPP